MNDKIVNVFLAFTEESRCFAEAVKEELEVLNRGISIDEKLIFRSHEWKTSTTPEMGNPEERILKQMPLQEFNIFLGVFRFEYGTPTGNINPETKEPFKSGMEEEFYYARKISEVHNTLQIMIFKSAEEYVPRALAMKGKIPKIEEYFEDFKPGGKHPGLYKEFTDKEDFLKQFRSAIFRYCTKFILQRRQEEQPILNNILQQRGYVEIFTNDDNIKRNSAKIAEIKSTKKLCLHAKSCHAFLARGIVFNEEIRNALERGMTFQVIMQNPWSLNSLYLSLNRDEFESRRQYNDYLRHKMSSEEILEIFQRSHWYTERFSLCIKGYEELRKQYSSKIELRVSDMDASNSLFLSENYLFFEPYINTVRAGQKSLSLFEVQVSKESDLYRDSSDYFETVWKSGYSYRYFCKNQEFFKKRLKGYLDYGKSDNES